MNDCSKIKYSLLLSSENHNKLISNKFSGVYRWLDIFEGQIIHKNDISADLLKDSFNIIHINFPDNIVNSAERIIKKPGKNKNTLIAVSCDIDPENWDSKKINLKLLREQLLYADMIFGTDYNIVSTLEELSKRRVHLIPHPMNYRKDGSDIDSRQDKIAFICSGYDEYTHMIYKQLIKTGLLLDFIFYNFNPDNIPGELTDISKMTNSYSDLCEKASVYKFLFVPYNFYGCTELIKELAASEIPVVGNYLIESISRCYPFTAVDVHKTEDAVYKIKQTVNDKVFNNFITNFALHKTQYYNPENSKQRFFQALYDETGNEKF